MEDIFYEFLVMLRGTFFNDKIYRNYDSMAMQSILCFNHFLPIQAITLFQREEYFRMNFKWTNLEIKQ